MLPARFVVVLDANVLFPFVLRDTLLRAASEDFYQLHWSSDILDEMERNLVAKAVMSAEKASRLRVQMESVFPEAEVDGYDPLIPSMANDEKDRHVVAAAVKAGAQVIVTFNLKDFYDLPTGIEAQSPDVFLGNIFDLAKEKFADLLQAQASDLNNPAVTLADLLKRLSRVAPDFAAAVNEHLNQVKPKP